MIHLIATLDTSVLDYLYSIRSFPATIFFIAVSEFGREIIVFLIVIVLALWYVYRKQFADVFGLIVSVFGTATTILILKYAISRPRPGFWFQAYPEGPFYSFPSAHAGLSIALYGFLIYLLLQTYPTAFRRVAIAILPLLIFLIGFSRLYLGVHYFSDVIAGYVVGVFFIWLGIQLRLRFLG